MNPTTAYSLSEEEHPFVHEECGDSMWDAVLAQPEVVSPVPAPAPALEQPAPTRDESDLALK